MRVVRGVRCRQRGEKQDFTSGSFVGPTLSQSCEKESRERVIPCACVQNELILEPHDLFLLSLAFLLCTGRITR